MALPLNLDPDLLRTFVAIAETQSFTRAADLVGRTQSAVSMQVRRLEDVLHRSLFRRTGKGVMLTEHGHFLLERARPLPSANDALLAAFREPLLEGGVRLGTPDDYATRWLPDIFSRFAATHPAVEIEVVCAPSNHLRVQLDRGDLDLCLISDHWRDATWPIVWRGPLVWVGAVGQKTYERDPFPLALSGRNCAWSTAAKAALDSVGRRWRAAYTSESFTGQHAAVLAGLAVAVCTPKEIPESLRILGANEGLPPIGSFGIALAVGPKARQPVTDVLARQITDSFRAATAADEALATPRLQRVG